jgi:hypothetical protein
MRALAGITITMFSVAGNGVSIAAQIVTQAIVSFVCALFGLYVLHLNVSALLLGACCGQFAALASAFYTLRKSVAGARPSRVWIKRAATMAPITSALGLAEGARGALDNMMLASANGLASAGYFAHARLYNGLLMALTNSVAHNAWSMSLGEARDPLARFAATARAWAPIQLGLVLCGLAFAFLGHETVDFISHGKLTAAAAYVPPLIVVLLIQTSGKPATALVYANNLAIAAARFRLALLVLGSLSLWLAIRWFGIAGLVTVMLAEAIAYRFWLRVLAARTACVPFHDHVIVAGIFAIAASAAFVDVADPSLPVRAVLAAGAVAICLGSGWHVITDLFSTGMAILGGRTSPPTSEMPG